MCAPRLFNVHVRPPVYSVYRNLHDGHPLPRLSFPYSSEGYRAEAQYLENRSTSRYLTGFIAQVPIQKSKHWTHRARGQCKDLGQPIVKVESLGGARHAQSLETYVFAPQELIRHLPFFQGHQHLLHCPSFLVVSLSFSPLLRSFPSSSVEHTLLCFFPGLAHPWPSV